MSTSEIVWFISAGMDKPKKRDHLLSRRQQYLNYGALTLATILSQSGYQIRLLHGAHTNVDEFVRSVVQRGVLGSKYPLLLSIPSFYALSWAQKFTEAIKNISPTTRIIVGGRWVVASDSVWLKSKLPNVDKIVPGLAENTITALVSGNSILELQSIRRTGVPVFNLDHRLVHDYHEYQPSVEASRGCGMGCAFCEERDIPLTRLKDPGLLVEHLHGVAEHYEDWSIRPYVQSSFFAPNQSWADKMANEVARHSRVVKWRCETRVDSIKPASVPALAAAGLRVIDLGLESGSPQQIIQMHKSQKPDRYLNAASELINACAKSGVWVKVNFLIYAGESDKTYSESIGWLDDHRDSIKGISAGPVVVFGSPSTAQGLLKEIVSSGGRLVDDESNAFNGVGEIHPSNEISSEDAEVLSLEASRRYMTKNDYYDLKSFSYYPRSYQRDDFENDVQISDESKLPFRSPASQD